MLGVYKQPRSRALFEGPTMNIFRDIEVRSFGNSDQLPFDDSRTGSDGRV